VTLPDDFVFATAVCTIGGVAGTRELPLVLDVSYLNVDSTCTDTATQALTINPDNPDCVPPPPPTPPEVTQINPVGGACADAGAVSVAAPAPVTTPITFRNDGGQALTIARGAVTGPNASDFSVQPSSAFIEPGQVATFIVSFDPAAPSPPVARTANVAFTTNDPDESIINVCLEGDANP
jgi:hypothetical protein